MKTFVLLACMAIAFATGFVVARKYYQSRLIQLHSSPGGEAVYISPLIITGIIQLPEHTSIADESIIYPRRTRVETVQQSWIVKEDAAVIREMIGK